MATLREIGGELFQILSDARKKLSSLALDSDLQPVMEVLGAVLGTLLGFLLVLTFIYAAARACRQLSQMTAAMRCIAPRNVFASLS
jgi:uncharacterized membrane protein required for colicin V production